MEVMEEEVGILVIMTQSSLSDLSHLKSGALYKAEDGQSGQAGKKKGASGKNFFLRVPPDTICCNLQGDVLQEIQDKSWTVLSGGKGGKGNVFFKSARFQAPKKAQKGEPARQKDIILELKWKSTACLVGLRGSGKTSLMFHLSNRWKKNKLYPSIKPQLFSMKFSNLCQSSIVFVDLPGISSSTIRFLKQAERSKMMLFVVSVDDDSPFDSYQYLRTELLKYDKKYNSSLIGKKTILILTGQKPILKKIKAFQDNHIKYISLFDDNYAHQKEILITEMASIASS